MTDTPAPRPPRVVHRPGRRAGTGRHVAARPGRSRLVPCTVLAAGLVAAALGAPRGLAPGAAAAAQLAGTTSSTSTGSGSGSTGSGGSSGSSGSGTGTAPALPPAPAAFSGQLEGIYAQEYQVQQTLQAKGAPTPPAVSGTSGSGTGGSGSGSGGSGTGSGGSVVTPAIAHVTGGSGSGSSTGGSGTGGSTGGSGTGGGGSVATPAIAHVTGSSGSGSSTGGSSLGTTQLPSTTQFDSMVSHLTPQQLAQFYAVTQQVHGWNQVPALYQQLQQDANQVGAPPPSSVVAVNAAVRSAGTGASGSGSGGSGSGASGSGTGGSGSGTGGPDVAAVAHTAAANGAGVHLLALSGSSTSAGTFPPTPPTGSFPAPPSAYQPSNPIAPANIPTTCPPPPPGPDGGAAAIFAAQEVTDILSATATALAGNIGVIVAGTPATFPDPAGLIAQALAQASQLVVDTFNFLAAANNDCGAAQTIGLAANIDNTTVNIYDLSQLIEGAIGSITNGVDTISGQVSTVQQTLDDELTLAIEQALTAPMSAVPNLAYELPATVGGNLDSTPVGVQSVVASAISHLQAAGEPVNPAAAVDLQQADQALAAGQYALAYTSFHQAYLQAVQ